jgi:tRNA/tmRNA/rRNA uracil-C5-methylase (TrmA/RlmC/RlmD family)
VEFKKRMIDIRNKYLFETKSFAIVIPNTTGEIIYEGQQLHHCVGTYVDRVIKGETVILFIREKETLDSPFYTMEVKNGKVVQVRGKNNCDMTTQVKQFVESFKRNRLLDESESEVIRIA